MFTLLLLSCAAPVPPPSKSLRTEALIGLWTYRYGEQREGLMLLQENGLYFSRHSEQSQLIYCGLWWVDGDTLCLTETSYHPEALERKWSRNWTPYRFRFDLSDRFCYKGKTGYAIEVALSDRREPDTTWLPALEPDW